MRVLNGTANLAKELDAVGDGKLPGRSKDVISFADVGCIDQILKQKGRDSRDTLAFFCFVPSAAIATLS